MSDENEQFERRLRRQPMREIPAGWRVEILSVARASQPTRPSSYVTSNFWLSTLNTQLSTLFWPHPKAWAGLGAVWIFILILNFSTRDHSAVMAEKLTPMPPEVVAELRQQKLLFSELLGTTQTQEADRRKNAPPGPRSERVDFLMT